MKPILIYRSYVNLISFVLLFTIMWLLMFPRSHWVLGLVMYSLITFVLFLVMFILGSTPAIVMDEQKITIRLPGGGQFLWTEIRSAKLKRPVRAGTVLEINLENGARRMVSVSSLDLPPAKILELILSQLK